MFVPRVILWAAAIATLLWCFKVSLSLLAEDISTSIRAPPGSKTEEYDQLSNFIDPFEYQQSIANDIIDTPLNDRPVIAVVTQPCHELLCDETTEGGSGFVAASYVKWLESAGARPIPLHHNAPDSYTDKIFRNVNGVLFTGGVHIPPAKSARRIYALAEEANNKFDVSRDKVVPRRTLRVNYIDKEVENVEPDYFPIWGTCLGYEWLLQMGAGKDSILDSDFDSWNMTLPLLFTNEGLENTQIFSDDKLLSMASTLPITMNNHKFGIEPEHFYADASLREMYTVSSINYDRTGRPFVSTVEGVSVPFYGVQWHPEKNNFEYGAAGHENDIPYSVINHSDSAVKLSFEMARFFVKESRRSTHRFTDVSDL
eukprot:CAMPEP_0113330232 /NCGR_PEP_ID=MMETSP0010_2-20120614/21470_1 /TAXON_ID=216773 ORGANISM="Corethron hystrix, Strain 308" /NCGR_SAMPLE_ID=MMETSP0010_2 /ASSEMBLY_ACC=CAM_ASM_000155 /LENGTH=369 /DNA_ID=CAMNT_0000192667 /DNA_START=269 /DNA_END=1375 /DNA_ORIENTATION=+ /assembly_acc=CAM_ASM_000155